MVFEDQHVAEALVVFEIEHAVAISPQDVFDGLLWKLSERGLVLRRFNDHFVGADAVHLVEKAFAFAVEFAFDAKGREAVRHHTDIPSRGIRSSAVAPVGKNFRWRFDFISRTEGTVLGAPRKDALSQEIIGPLTAVGRNNHPATRDRVLA